MLDVGFSELLLTSAIALIVLGPERLPKVARQVGNWMGRARAMARQLTEQLEREVDADELLKQTQSKKVSTRSPAVGPAAQDAASYPPPATPAVPTPPVPTAAVVTPAAASSAARSPVFSPDPAAAPHGADWQPAPPDIKPPDG